LANSIPYVDRRSKDFLDFYRQTIARLSKAQQRLAPGVRLLGAKE
jgi:hypothetical protein